MAWQKSVRTPRNLGQADADFGTPQTVLFSLPAKLSVLHEGCAAGIRATLANVSQRLAQSATALVRAQSRTAQPAHSSQSHFRGRARNSVSLYRSLSKDSCRTSAKNATAARSPPAFKLASSRGVLS